VAVSVRGAGVGIPLLLMLAACTSLPFLESAQKRQDRELAARVKSALAADPKLSGSRIEVEVEASKVTLLGTVPTWREGYRAIEVAVRTTGVRTVSSRLTPAKQ
jgi:osmotically-inducible protein OsmY